MRANLRRAYTVQYMLGRGGRGQMGQRDFGILGSLLKKQYKFLANFAGEVANGRYSANQVASVATRQQLYSMSSNQAYERGKAEAWGLVDLPAMPGDGSSECMSNDQCSWEFEETEEEVLAYWRLGVAEHCPTCLDRAKKWAPLRFPKR